MIQEGSRASMLEANEDQWLPGLQKDQAVSAGVTMYTWLLDQGRRRAWPVTIAGYYGASA